MSTTSKLDILVEEYKIISENIEQFQRVQVNYLISLIIIVGGMISFYFSSEVQENLKSLKFLNEFYHIFPLTLAAFISLISYHYRRVLGFQGYKRYLEEKINSEVQEDIIFYSLIGFNRSDHLSKPNFNLFLFVNWTLYISIYLFSVFLAFKNSTYKPLIIVHIIVTMLLIIGLINTSHRFDKVYSASKKENEKII